jgi:enterochelin esterase-like enzyme
MSLVDEYEIDSVNAAGRRFITVFIPPGSWGRNDLPVLYCTDGQTIGQFAERLDREMRNSEVPKVLLVGVHSDRHCREKEYIPGVDAECFELHERFFAEVVYQWSRSEFGIVTSRESCGIFGCSHGAIFALALAARQPAKYGAVIAFSVPGSTKGLEAAERLQCSHSRFYLAAGTRERPVCRATRAVSNVLTKHNVEHVCSERFGAHDFNLWDAELPEALRWAFR